jgi:hypothetical protein
MTPLFITVDLVRTPWRDVSPDIFTECQLSRIGLVPWTVEDTTPEVVMLAYPDGRPTKITTSYRLFASAARVLAATASGRIVAEDMGWS